MNIGLPGIFRRGSVALAVIALVAFVTNPVAAQVRAAFEPTAERHGSLALAAAASDVHIEIPPSVTTSAIGRSDSKIFFDVFCLDPAGQIVPNCDFVIEHKVLPFTGGHDHDDANRPKGTFEPDRGNTGPSGVALVIYTAPEVSGIIEGKLIVTAPGFGTGESIRLIGVRINGLEELPAGEDYLLVGATATHSTNHFGTATMNGSLVGLAASYVDAFPGEKLSYNDMSLFQGGLFDIGGNWSPPHVSHRFGDDIDVALVPPARRNRLRQLARASGIPTIIVEGNHWHLRQ